MKTALTLKIVSDIVNKTDISKIEIRSAKEEIYLEYDKNLELVDKEYPNEFDVIILDDIQHWELQVLDGSILGKYDNVEMVIEDGALRIFENQGDEKENE